MAWPRKSYFFKKECDNVIADGSYLELACSIIDRYKEIHVYIYESVHLYTRMYYGSVHVYVSTDAYTLTYTFFFFAEMTDLADEFDDSTCGRW